MQIQVDPQVTSPSAWWIVLKPTRWNHPRLRTKALSDTERRSTGVGVLDMGSSAGRYKLRARFELGQVDGSLADVQVLVHGHVPGLEPGRTTSTRRWCGVALPLERLLVIDLSLIHI